MARRDDVKGYLLVDEKGRVIVIGDGLRKDLRALAGYYTHLPSDRTLLHFQRATTAPAFDEFKDPTILQGDIAGMGSTIEVINFVHSSQLSGNLVFVSQNARKCLYFLKGEIRGASSNVVEDRLGEIMYRYGALDRDELDRAVKDARALRRPFGNLLLDRGIINQADLYVYVKRQVEEIFYSILLIKHGDFYLTQFDVESLPAPLSMNAQSMLMEGLRRIDEMSYFKEKIPGQDTRLTRGKPTDGVELEEKEELLLSLVQDSAKVGEIIRASRLGEFETLKVLFHLLQAGYLRTVETRDYVSEGVELDEASAEMSTMVDTFNSVFQRIFQAISRHGQQNALKQGLERFLQYYGFVELFMGVTFDSTGALDKARLLENLKQNQIENQASFLSQALNELLFFEMFAAREWLEREEQQDLQRMINQVFIEIG